MDIIGMFIGDPCGYVIFPLLSIHFVEVTSNFCWFHHVYYVVSLFWVVIYRVLYYKRLCKIPIVCWLRVTRVIPCILGSLVGYPPEPESFRTQRF